MGRVRSSACSGFNAPGSIPAGTWLGSSQVTEHTVLFGKCLAGHRCSQNYLARHKRESRLGRRAIPSGETCERSWMRSGIMLAVEDVS